MAPDDGCNRPMMERLIEEAHLSGRIVECTIDRIEIRGEGKKLDIGKSFAIGQDIAVYLDGERLEGWESLTLHVAPNKMVTLDLRLPTNVTITCPTALPGGDTVGG